MSINIYFYRTRNRGHVIEQWDGCTAVPRPGDTVRLGEAQAEGTVMEVTWSKPNPAGPQIAYVYVNLFTTKVNVSGATGVQFGDYNNQNNVFNERVA